MLGLGWQETVNGWFVGSMNPWWKRGEDVRIWGYEIYESRCYRVLFRFSQKFNEQTRTTCFQQVKSGSIRPISHSASDLAIPSLPKSPWNLAKHRGLSWAESWQYNCVVALQMKQLEFWPLIGTKATKVSQTPCWKVYLSWQVIRNPEGLKDTSSNKSSEWSVLTDYETLQNNCTNFHLPGGVLLRFVLPGDWFAFMFFSRLNT